MDTQSFYTRQMLLQYGKQLVAARRLARFELLTGRAVEASEASVAAQRQVMIERIAREIVDNLIFSGSENSIVVQVREALCREVGEELVFRYPPNDLRFKVFRKTADGEEELQGEKKHMVMAKLWEVTVKTVDATML